MLNFLLPPHTHQFTAITLPVSLPKALPFLQPTFIRRTTERCLGAFIPLTFFTFCNKCNVSHYKPYFFISFVFEVLWALLQL
jgi:hypothetical protein